MWSGIGMATFTWILALTDHVLNVLVASLGFICHGLMQMETPAMRIQAVENNITKHENQMFRLIHCSLVDFSTLMYWKSPFDT